VQSPAFHDDDHVEGAYDSTSIRAVMINQPRQRLYDYWRDFRNLPRFMENVKSVDLLDDSRSSWSVAGPAGAEIELVSEITEDRPGEYIAWSSTEDSDVDHQGWIEFRDGPPGRGTEVTATIVYEPPGGDLGKLIAKLFQKEPKIQARRELRRFKQLMETGEISTAKTPDAAPQG
jgi:uncharacterized membrane protein